MDSLRKGILKMIGQYVEETGLLLKAIVINGHAMIAEKILDGEERNYCIAIVKRKYEKGKLPEYRTIAEIIF